MEEKFTKKAQSIIENSKEEAENLGHSYIGSEHLLLALIKEESSISSKILTSHGATYNSIKEMLVLVMGNGVSSSLTKDDITPRLKRILEKAKNEAIRNGQNYIGSEHILLAVLDEKDSFGLKILEKISFPITEAKNDIYNYLSTLEKKIINDEGKKAKSKSKTPIQNYGINLIEKAENGKIEPIFCRDEEIEKIIRVLCRKTKNNPLLIGEPGVGKTAIVEGLAKRISDGKVPDILLDKVVFSLDIPSIIAGAKYRGEFEERMKGIINECANDESLILFIDEIHTIIGAGSAEGAIDCANIIKPYLARGELRVIGATTNDEYKKHIEKDSALERRFSIINVEEPSREETIDILKGLKDRFEAHHKLKISDDAITAAVDLSIRYINNRYLPDKAIDLIDETASMLKIEYIKKHNEKNKLNEKLKSLLIEKEEAINEQNFDKAIEIRNEELRAKEDISKLSLLEKTKDIEVSSLDISKVITEETGIPTQKLFFGENNNLTDIEKRLKDSIVGQDEAINKVSMAIKRGFLGIGDRNRPIGSFLFVGKTGVGKTELCKSIAKELFGSSDAYLRFDMSEYSEKHSISKLIGAPPGYVGYDEGGLLTDKVRKKPFSLILFDEIEKAHPDIFNILLQILDDGRLSDSFGRIVNFKNTIIILTSNLGNSNSDIKNVGFTDDETSSKEKVEKAINEAFRKELLNRIDEIVHFNSLSKKDLYLILDIYLKKLEERLSDLSIKLTVTQSAKEFLIDKGYSEIYGARELKRTITKYCENEISNLLTNNKRKITSEIKITSDGNCIILKTGGK